MIDIRIVPTIGIGYFVNYVNTDICIKSKNYLIGCVMITSIENITDTDEYKEIIKKVLN